jgi:hypothetical protein
MAFQGKTHLRLWACSQILDLAGKALKEKHSSLFVSDQRKEVLQD